MPKYWTLSLLYEITRKISQDLLGFFSVSIEFPFFPEIHMLSRDFSSLFCLCMQMALASYSLSPCADFCPS